MAGRGQGSEPRGVGGSGADAGLSCRGLGVTCSVVGRGGGGQPGLPRPAGACRARDMMIDWVSSRLRGDAAAQSIQAVRLALRGRTGSG